MHLFFSIRSSRPPSKGQALSNALSPKIAAAKDAETAELLDLLELDSPYFALKDVRSSKTVCLLCLLFLSLYCRDVYI
jgi:hypothetical protein